MKKLWQGAEYKRNGRARGTHGVHGVLEMIIRRCPPLVHGSEPKPPERREVERKTNDVRAKKRMEADYNVRMRVREPAITVGSKALVKLNKQRKNTSAWDVVISYTKCPSLLT